MPNAKSTDMIITEFESNGFYEPGFLHLNINTDQSLENLNDLIESTLKRFEIRLQNKNIHVVFEKPEDEIIVNSDFSSVPYTSECFPKASPK